MSKKQLQADANIRITPDVWVRNKINEKFQKQRKCHGCSSRFGEDHQSGCRVVGQVGGLVTNEHIQPTVSVAQVHVRTEDQIMEGKKLDEKLQRAKDLLTLAIVGPENGSRVDEALDLLVDVAVARACAKTEVEKVMEDAPPSDSFARDAAVVVREAIVLDADVLNVEALRAKQPVEVAMARTEANNTYVVNLAALPDDITLKALLGDQRRVPPGEVIERLWKFFVDKGLLQKL